MRAAVSVFRRQSVLWRKCAMPYLYFELNEPENRQQEYSEHLRQYSDACRASAEFMLRAMELMSVSKLHPGKHFPGVVFLLARHVAEEVDAISVLAERGCAQPCKLHLRSAFEAGLGILYILEDHSEERALSNHVAEMHKRIKSNRRLNENDDLGKQLRKQVEHDEVGTDILSSLPPVDFAAEVARLESRLSKPPYDLIEVEWQRTAKKLKRKYPSWHSLFDGPVTIRDLAYHLKKGFWYEFQYGDWSETIHAASGFRQVAQMKKSENKEDKALRPLRHPDGLRNVCDLASGIVIELELKLADAFLGKVAKNILHDQYMADVRPRLQAARTFTIKADWA